VTSGCLTVFDLKFRDFAGYGLTHTQSADVSLQQYRPAGQWLPVASYLLRISGLCTYGHGIVLGGAFHGVPCVPFRVGFEVEKASRSASALPGVDQFDSCICTRDFTYTIPFSVDVSYGLHYVFLIKEYWRSENIHIEQSRRSTNVEPIQQVSTSYLTACL
jgi:hypothetical protein